MKLLKAISIYPIFFATSTLLQGCLNTSDSSSSNIKTEFDVAIQQAVDYSIIAAVDNFDAQTETLNTQAATFCSNGNTTANTLTELQTQWKTVQDAWYQLQPFNFGPLTHDDVYWYIDSFRGNDGRNFTETVRTFVKTQVNSTNEITANTVSSASSTSGLLPLEILLFETLKDASDATSQLVADIAAEYVSAPRKCQLLTTYTAELNRLSGIVASGWKTNYRDTGKGYRDLLLNEELEKNFAAFDTDGSGAPVAEVLITALHDYFDYLANPNRPLTTSMGQLSNSIWPAIDTSVTSFETFMTGTSNTTTSLFNQMEKNGAAADVAIVQANIATLKATLAEKNTTDMRAAAATLDGNLEHEIPDALDASLGLSFNDGD